MGLQRLKTPVALKNFADSQGVDGGLDGYSVKTEREVVFPYLESTSRKPWLAVGLSKCYEARSDGKQHTVTLLYGRDDLGELGFSVVCGDTFIAGTSAGGRITGERRGRLVLEQALVEGAVLAGSERGLLVDMVAHYGSIPGDTGCHFYKTINKARAGVTAGCKHVKAWLHELNLSGEIIDTAERLQGRYEALASAGAAYAMMAPIDGMNLMERVSGLLDPAAMFKVPVMLEGPSGWGKTYVARELGMSGKYDAFVECSGHSGMEAFDFIGGYTRCGNDYMWLDGPITRAFRLASRGMKVFLLVDELLRVPRRERDVFLTALTPHDNVYRLCSGRAVGIVDGIAEQEVLLAPMENLSFVASTNVGVAYDIDPEDPALSERFLRIYVGKDMVMAREVLTKMVAQRAVTDSGKWPVSVVDQIVKFMGAMEILSRDNVTSVEPSLRMATRAVQMASSGADVGERLLSFVPTWVGRTLHGEPIREQVAAVGLAIRSAFPA